VLEFFFFFFLLFAIRVPVVDLLPFVLSGRADRGRTFPFFFSFSPRQARIRVERPPAPPPLVMMTPFFFSFRFRQPRQRGDPQDRVHPRDALAFSFLSFSSLSRGIKWHSFFSHTMPVSGWGSNPDHCVLPFFPSSATRPLKNDPFFPSLFRY